MHIDTQAIIGVIGFTSLVVTGILFIISQVRRNDIKILRDANQDLRDSIEDKSNKIDELTVRVDMLGKKVAVLEAQNSDLQILVKEALVIYFTRYPNAATELNK